MLTDPRIHLGSTEESAISIGENDGTKYLYNMGETNGNFETSCSFKGSIGLAIKKSFTSFKEFKEQGKKHLGTIIRNEDGDIYIESNYFKFLKKCFYEKMFLKIEPTSEMWNDKNFPLTYNYFYTKNFRKLFPHHEQTMKKIDTILHNMVCDIEDGRSLNKRISDIKETKPIKEVMELLN